MTMLEKAIDHYHYGVTHDIFSEPVTSYATLAINALKKQIPKKVIFDGYFYGYTHRCPSCNSQVDNHSYGVNDAYCRMCGQALDWSE